MAFSFDAYLKLNFAHLTETHLREAHLEGADLSEAYLERARLVDVILSNWDNSRLDQTYRRAIALYHRVDFVEVGERDQVIEMRINLTPAKKE